MIRALPTLLAALLALVHTQAAADPAAQAKHLQAPAGFSISLAARVPEARQLALDPDSGVLFVGSRRDGRVHALADPDGDGIYAAPIVVASDLRLPSGLALHNGDLYVGAVSRILRFPDAVKRAQATFGGATGAFPQELVTDQLPSDGHHGWKYLRFLPDGTLLVPVGAPCNICDEPMPYASILAMDVADGSWTPYARGVRNTVGMAVHPVTDEVWFTDNGRDMLGDDVPPEEVNRVRAPGLHFGYPYVHAGTIPDPEYGERGDGPFEAPALTWQAHSAGLGLVFHPGTGLPEDYRHALFIAEHGSWNRSSKVGYRVSVAFLDASGTRILRHAPFVTGWLQGEEAWGRPSDVLVAPDGSLLVADDRAGAVWRVRWTGQQRPSPTAGPDVAL